MTKRTIPEIRHRLREIACELRQQGLTDTGDEIWQLAQETIRNSPSRKRAPVKHAPLTLADKAAIRLYAKLNPDAHLSEIASHFDTNPGRVSEALAEKVIDN